jgi:hypothetical protein
MWLLVSPLLQGESKLATGNSFPSSQTVTEVPMEWKPPQRSDEIAVCLPTKAEEVRTVEAGHEYLWSG